MSGPGKYLSLITTREIPKRRMKETLFTRHRNTVEPMMLVDNRKATLQAIHTDTVNKAVTDQKMNIVLDELPHLINNSEKDLTGKECATLAHLRSGYCKLLGFYKSRIKLVSMSVSNAASISLLARYATPTTETSNIHRMRLCGTPLAVIKYPVSITCMQKLKC